MSESMTGINLGDRVENLHVNFRANIVFLQETQLRVADHARLMRPWIVFHSAFYAKCRGTAIPIKKKSQFIPEKIILDRNGCFVTVSGPLFHIPVTLVCVYAPNFDDENYMTALLSSIPDMDTYRLIFGGDLSCVMDTLLDCSHSRGAISSKMSRPVKSFMEDYRCGDPWRFLHPDSKAYSFFSHVHHVYSRIDYFFIERTLIPCVQSFEYSTIVISDHSPLLLHLRLVAPTDGYM